MSNRTLFVALLLALILLPGCINKKKISGKDFVPREVLVDLLVDIHLVDGITNDRKFYRRYEDTDSIDVLGPILDKYEVSRQMFDTTMFQYSRHPDLMDQVYNEVLMKLNIMLDENDLVEDVSREEK
ncbi:MAG: DUF4296 domain-containing protein [Bacteroidota bacterium]